MRRNDTPTKSTLRLEYNPSLPYWCILSPSNSYDGSRGKLEAADHLIDKTGKLKRGTLDYWCFQLAGLFSANADMPSFWSSRENIEWNMRRSKRRPSAKLSSLAAFTVSFAMATAGRENEAILLPSARAVSNNCIYQQRRWLNKGKIAHFNKRKGGKIVLK